MRGEHTHTHTHTFVGTFYEREMSTFSYRALLKSKREGKNGTTTTTATTTMKTLVSQKKRKLDDEKILSILRIIAIQLRVNNESEVTGNSKNNNLFLLKHHAEVLHGDTDASYTWKRKALELIEEGEEYEIYEERTKAGGKDLAKLLLEGLDLLTDCLLTTKLYEPFITAVEST